MKTITKIKNNLGKVAGSALLVGATVAGGAAMVSAQDNGSSGSLGDFPAPFVSDDGEVDTSVVVGETAEDGQPVSTLDVVSGVEIAGTLGNAAFTETEETVSVDAGVAGWSAEEGITLNRPNNNLFLTDFTNSGETRLDGRDVSVLETVSFTSEDGDDVSVEFEVNPGQEDGEDGVVQQFNDGPRNADDPVLHVEVPTRGSVDADTHVLSALAEFDETIDFTVQQDDGDTVSLEDGDEIELFGNSYVYSDDSDTDELILFGDSETFDVDRGEEYTATVEGNEHTFEVVSVSDDNDRATIRVDGSLRTVDEDDSVRVSGQEVRVRDIFSFGDNDGVVQFAIGSEELALQADGDIEVDGDRVRGVEHDATDLEEVDEINFYFGGQENDQDHVAAGDTYQDPIFGLEFHYGGINPDTTEDFADRFEVDADDDEATLDLQLDGEEVAVTLAESDGDNNVVLGPDEEDLATFQGEWLSEDRHTVLNSDDQAGLYQVTSLLVDSGADGSADGEVSFELENVVTGSTVEIEEDDLTDAELSEDENNFVEDNVRIDGMRFDVEFRDDSSEGEVVRLTETNSDDVVVYPSLYTDSDSGASFVDTAEDVYTSELDSDDEFNLRLPGAFDTDNTINVDYDSSDGSLTVEDTVDADPTDVTAGETRYVAFDAGETTYILEAAHSDDEGTDDEEGEFTFSLHLASDQEEDINSETAPDVDEATVRPGYLFTQPEDDNDAEHGIVVDVENTGDEIDGIDVTATSGDTFFDDNGLNSLDSDDDTDVGYTTFGSYLVEDTDDEGGLVAHVPNAQATSGMAITGPDGSLTAGGGTADGTVTSMSPTYEFADGVLDSDGNIGQVQNSDNLVLVGGPSVNALVAELADEGETWTADEYTEGEGLIQHVPDAFSEGQDAVIVAGYSGEDTRAAGEFLADYRNNEGALEGETQVTISTESGQVVN